MLRFIFPIEGASSCVASIAGDTRMSPLTVWCPGKIFGWVTGKIPGDVHVSHGLVPWLDFDFGHGLSPSLNFKFSIEKASSGVATVTGDTPPSCL